MDVAINGSFWVGAALGSLLTIPLLDLGRVKMIAGTYRARRSRTSPSR